MGGRTVAGDPGDISHHVATCPTRWGSQERQHNLVERANGAALHENTMENLAPVRRPSRARPQHPRAEHASPELQAAIAGLYRAWNATEDRAEWKG
jgi:hypothetical protein